MSKYDIRPIKDDNDEAFKVMEAEMERIRAKVSKTEPLTPPPSTDEPVSGKCANAEE